MGDVVLHVSNWEENSTTPLLCRICHEEEHESCKSLETPCACAGTVKYAHRDCIQRWCNEKFNTTCEICLQSYEPGYTAPSNSNKPHLIEAAVSIGDSLEIPGREHEQEIPSPRYVAISEETTVEPDLECRSAADRSASICRSVALTFTYLLLLRHLFATLTIGTENYPFTLVTVLVLKASGIIFPMYIVMKAITALHNSIKRKDYEDDDSDSDDEEEEEEEQRQHHTD